MKLAVHFGAGNIGRGFITPTLQANDYKVILVDVNADLISIINKKRQYIVKSLNQDGYTNTKIENIKAINLSNDPQLNEALLDADLVTTSVGPKFVEGIYERFAKLDNSKEQIFIAFENMYRASSRASSTIKSKNQNLKIIDSVVDKIVPPQSQTSLDVTVETYGSIILDNTSNLQPLAPSEVVSYKNYENEFYKKLWLLNGLHLQLAYYGLSMGYEYIHEVISSTQGREFTEDAIKSLAEAYQLLTETTENLDFFCRNIVNRFSLVELKDQVSRIARNPEIKFSKDERFEFPLRLLLEKDRSIQTFKTIFDILIDQNFENVEGFYDFKNSVLNKGKTNIYMEYWKINKNINQYQQNLGA